jgi:small basic protein
MKAWMPVACFAAGFALGVGVFTHFNWQVSREYAPYISVAALAGIDTVCGGVRAGIEGRFQNDIFASGFVLNTVLAAGLAWFGDRMGLDLALVAVIALGSRIFLNLSLIRRYYLNRIAMARSRQQEESAASPVPQTTALGQKPEIGGGI